MPIMVSSRSERSPYFFNFDKNLSLSFFENKIWQAFFNELHGYAFWYVQSAPWRPTLINGWVGFVFQSEPISDRFNRLICRHSEGKPDGISRSLAVFLNFSLAFKRTITIYCTS